MQHISVFKAGRALLHPQGTPETNRARTVQVEIVGNAKDMNQLTRNELKSLARLARWIERNAGVPSKCDVGSRPSRPRSASRSACRDRKRIDHSGHLGHMHVPANDHEDPGALAIDELLAN